MQGQLKEISLGQFLWGTVWEMVQQIQIGIKMGKRNSN